MLGFAMLACMFVAQVEPVKDNPFVSVLRRLDNLERELALVTTTPAAMWRAAARDLATLPASTRPYTRYLSIAEVDPASRKLMFQVLCGHVHLLTRGSTIEPLVPVPGTEWALLRMNILRYGWPIDLWEKLFDATPYETIDVAHGKGARRDLSPWIAADVPYPMLSALVRDSYSRLPVVNGQWFLNQTAISFNRKVGYYDWLGVKNEDEWDAFVGFDRKKKRRKVELRESVSLSGVAKQPRAIARWDADEGGYLWYTLDFDESLADRISVLDQLGRDGEEIYRSFAKDKVLVKKAASEKFGLNAVSFLVSGLFDPAGTRQDSAPDFVGHDKKTISSDGKIHVNVSCLRCHSNAGKQDITPWARNTFRAHKSGAFPLLSTKGYEDAELLRAQYIARQLAPYIESDRAKFDAAVREATGLSAKEWQAVYAFAWQAYEDASVDLKWAANQLRVSPERLEHCILAGTKQRDLYGAAVPVVPPTLAGLVAGESIGIRQWERAYPAAQILLRSVP